MLVGGSFHTVDMQVAVRILHLAFLMFIGVSFLFSRGASASSLSPSSPMGRQSAIEENIEIGETIVGLSSIEGDHLIVGVSSSHKLRVRNAGPVLMSLGHDDLVVGFVGLPSDRQEALRLARTFILDYFADTNEDIPVGILAMKLADEVYQRSRSPASAPLIFNAALMGRGTTHEKGRGVKLMKVDQSAGFFECKASIAIGYGAPSLNSWLQKRYHGSPAVDLKSLIKRGMECLQEMGTETMKGNEICCELCVMRAEAGSGAREVLGPVAISNISLSSNGYNSLNNVDVDEFLAFLSDQHT